MSFSTKEAQHPLLENEDSVSLLGESLAERNVRPSNKSASDTKLSKIIYWTILLSSLLANLILLVILHKTTRSQPSEQTCQTKVESSCQPCPAIEAGNSVEKSPYAGLSYNTNGTWEAETIYTQEDLKAADEAWMALDVTNAFVALTQQHAQAMGLPRSFRFPWDEGKDLYLISSIHSMHCLTVLHRSNLEYRNNHTQTYATEHILHCLDNIRVDIECSADDTPRHIPPGATESTVKTGVGQNRQCRNWSELNSWAKEHEACFRYNELLRLELKKTAVYPLTWQFCPKDSEYMPRIQQYFNKGSDWVPSEPDFPEIDDIQNNYSPASGFD